jgi:hypothetical protein
MLRKLVLTMAVMAPIVLLTASDAMPAAAQPRTGMTVSACSGTVEITHLAFKPPSIAPGGSSTAHLKARNCTDASIQAASTWIASFTGDTNGCPVIDPLTQPADFSPYGTVRSKVGYEVPSGCAATGLQLTVKISAGGTLLAQKTADLVIMRPPASSR